MIIGVLHPGEMGISLAASAIRSGHNVYWASDGRSKQTASRAAEYALLDAHSIEKLCHTSQVVLSICPPQAAEQVADQVLSSRFRGLYIDANAISPQRAEQMAERMTEAGVSFVDGCVIGGPAWNSGETWLYLSGEKADRAAEMFSGGPIETGVVGPQPGKASALKMCYASYTKGSMALLCAVLAAAEKSRGPKRAGETVVAGGYRICQPRSHPPAPNNAQSLALHKRDAGYFGHLCSRWTAG